MAVPSKDNRQIIVELEPKCGSARQSQQTEDGQEKVAECGMIENETECGSAKPGQQAEDCGARETETECGSTQQDQQSENKQEEVSECGMIVNETECGSEEAEHDINKMEVFGNKNEKTECGSATQKVDSELESECGSDRLTEDYESDESEECRSAKKKFECGTTMSGEQADECGSADESERVKHDNTEAECGSKERPEGGTAGQPTVRHTQVVYYQTLRNVPGKKKESKISVARVALEPSVEIGTGAAKSYAEMECGKSCTRTEYSQSCTRAKCGKNCTRGDCGKRGTADECGKQYSGVKCGKTCTGTECGTSCSGAECGKVEVIVGNKNENQDSDIYPDDDKMQQKIENLPPEVEKLLDLEKREKIGHEKERATIDDLDKEIMRELKLERATETEKKWDLLRICSEILEENGAIWEERREKLRKDERMKSENIAKNYKLWRARNLKALCLKKLRLKKEKRKIPGGRGRQTKEKIK